MKTSKVSVSAAEKSFDKVARQMKKIKSGQMTIENQQMSPKNNFNKMQIMTLPQMQERRITIDETRSSIISNPLKNL